MVKRRLLNLRGIGWLACKAQQLRAKLYPGRRNTGLTNIGIGAVWELAMRVEVFPVAHRTRDVRVISDDIRGRFFKCSDDVGIPDGSRIFT